MITVSDLVVTYDRGRFRALDGLDLSVRPGEVVAVVGESGSGKSTLAHAILGLLPAGGRICGGRISFGDLDLTSLGPRAYRGVRGRRIGLVPQDPAVSLNPVRRVGEQVAEALRVHGLAGRRAAALDAVDLLDRVGLPDPRATARRYPHELSGGMRQRVLIAIALAASPSLIVADEPTSALDVTVQRRILDLLQQVVADSGAGLLLITHDLGVAADRSDRIAVVSQGRVVEDGPAASVVSVPAHPYTRGLVAAAPSLASDPPVLPPVGGGTPLLVADGLVREFAGVRAVDDVSFEIGRGETLALVGESGSGKSTTARLVLGLTPATAGRVLLDGLPPSRELRRRMQVVQQNPYASLDPRHTVQRIVAEPLRVFEVPGAPGRVRELLDRVALPSSVLTRRPAELSGGQRQRVAIARALALSPDLVVLDEPVSALDVSVQAQVLDLLAELQAELGVSYLFISHDLAVVRRLAHRVGVLHRGRLVELGPAASVLDQPQAEHTRELVAAVPGRVFSREPS